MTRHVVLVLALTILAGDVYPAKSMPTKEQPLNDEHVSPDVEKAEVLLEELEELLDKEVMANNNGGDDDDDQLKRDFEPTDSCPTGWSSYGARCYQVFIGQRTFPEAVEFCESENARVALPKDQGINDHIVALRNSDSVAQQTSCWIGLEHEEVEGEHIYRWTDGELLGNYTNWATDPPEPNHAPGDADCVRMERNVPTSPGVSNQWRDFPCDDLLAVCVICEAEDCLFKETDTTYRYRWDLPQLTGTRFTFQVSASSNAHIGLSPENHDVTDMYEIVIGASWNSRSAIRREKLGPDLTNVPTPDINSPSEYRTFWINWASDGTISVGKGGESLPFMSWTDPNPVRVSYAGYSTGWGSDGLWKFCSETGTVTKRTSEVQGTNGKDGGEREIC